MPLSFRLTEDFLKEYRNKKVPWGYKDAGGNSVGEITLIIYTFQIKVMRQMKN